MQNAVVQNVEALLSQVFKFIEANYHQAISLNEVAQAVGYSPAYLTDLIRLAIGAIAEITAIPEVLQDWRI